MAISDQLSYYKPSGMSAITKNHKNVYHGSTIQDRDYATKKKGFLVNLQLEHVVRYFALQCYQSNKNAYHGSTFQDRDLQEKPNTTNHQLEDVFGHLG